MEYKLGSISVYSFNALYRAYTLVRNRRTDWRIKKPMAAAIANAIVRNPKSTLYYKMLQSICQFDVRFQTTENISIKCERGFKPFSHYFFTESEVQ